MIIKRDGTLVEFCADNIIKAVSKAFEEVDGQNYSKEIAQNIAEEVSTEYYAASENWDIEHIQDLVEKKLMQSERPDVAKSYILYREKRNRIRERKGHIIKSVLKRNSAEAVQNANANVDENSFSGREKEAASDIQKIIALDYTLSEEVSKAHKEMLLYQHDLEKTPLGVHNCLNLDFEELFSQEFVCRNGGVRPPCSVSTAFQLVAVAFQCQSQVQFGGVGSVHFDLDMTPYVKKSFYKHWKDGCKYLLEIDTSKYDDVINNTLSIEDESYKTFGKAYTYAMDMLEREGAQAAEGLVHNLNTLESRAGSQVPFTSVNFGQETTPEGRLICKWLLNASLNGIGKNHLTPIFPISIFQYKQGVNANPEDPNYDLKRLALKSLSKRIYPNFVNCDWSEAHEDPNNPDTRMSSMGCRTMLGFDRNGLGYIRVGRGNNVPNTIILPKLGIEYGICKGERKTADLEGFWEAFENTLKLAEKGLLERYEIMKKQSPAAAPFMYKNGTIKKGRDCSSTVEESLKHNTLAIGYLGIAEMCVALFGQTHTQNDEAYQFALKVVTRINEYAKEASERNNLNFSCYATPAEGLCSTALESLKKQYGVIPGVTDKDFITNSHHTPVWEKISIFEKLEKEAPFCKLATGGTITYVELDSTFMKNLDAIEQIIDHAFKVLNIPYLAFNFPIDNCLDCGYQSEFNNECPQCGSQNIQQLRRVTGYLSTDYRNFNKGKQAEVKARIKHNL